MIDYSSIRKKTEFILNRLLIVFFFAILAIYCSREISDLDIWLHLKTGELIIKNKMVPLCDIYSFTLGNKTWINHEWLFQVIAYLSYVCDGSDGLIIMQNLVIICVFLVLFFIGFNEKNHIFVFLILYFTLLTSAYRFTIRPDIFSLFFLALYLFILKNFSGKKKNYIWLLPLLQMIWVNMHGFSFTGPLIILIFLIGDIVKRTPWLPKEWQHIKRFKNNELKIITIVFLAVIAVSIINPHGINGALYPFSVLGQISGKGKLVFKYIQELTRPITFQTIFNLNTFFFYKVYILLSFFSFRINHKRVDISDFILWLSFLIFSFIAVRNIAYFSIVAAYVIFNNIHLAFKDKDISLFSKLPKKIQVISFYVVMVFLFTYPAKGAAKYLESANYNFDTYKLKSALLGLSELRYPEKALNFLLKYDFPKHMFNDFNSGSYLIGRGFPRRQVFIDGRTELYGPDFFENYVAFCEGQKEILEKTLTQYNIKGVFLTNGDNDLHAALLRYFFKNPHWKTVYFDECAMIFLKDVEENSSLIKKFQIDLNKWTPQKPDFLKLGIAFRYPWPFVERARILDMLNCHEAAAKEAKMALKIMPNNAKALKYMSNYYFEKEDYRKAYIFARNSLIYTPEDLWLRARLALIYYHLNEKEKGFKVIDAIIKNSPKFSQGYYIKAKMLQDSNSREAEKLLSKAIALAPKIPMYHVSLGDLLEKRGEIEKAQKEWFKALNFDSADQEISAKISKYLQKQLKPPRT